MSGDRHRGVPGRFNTSSSANRFRLMGPHANANNAAESGGTLTQISENTLSLLSMSNLENGIECVARALSSAPQDDPDLPRQLDSLVVSHPNLFSLARVDDHESLMKSMSRALAFVPEAHPCQPKWLSRLGASHGDQFKRLHGPGDLEKAIEYTTRALNLARDDDSDQPVRLNDLGEYHGYRFSRLGELGDLEKAVEYARRAVSSTPDSHLDRAKRLNNLGTLHNERFERLGVLEDNEKAIEHCRLALTLTSYDHSDLPKWLNTLGISYNSRFRRLGEPSDCDLAIAFISRAVDLTADDQLDLPPQLNYLGEAYRNRFQSSGDLGDLETALKCARRTLALAPNNHPKRSSWLNNLGTLYGDRFRRLGELTDSGEAIEYCSRALNSTPSGHPDLPKSLSSLAVLHGDRFRRLNELDDLQIAIDYMSRALTLTPDNHPNRSTQFNNLGELHGHRFRRLGDLGDLDKAMGFMRHALALTPDNHPELPCRLNNIGVLYSDRFRRLDKLIDSDEAINYGSRALDLTPTGHPDLPRLLSCLGASHRDRFKRLNESSDLGLAIDYMRRAETLTPEDHPDLSHRLSNLSVAHRDRFQHQRELSDYERAIEYGSRALKLTPDDHPDIPNRLCNLGELYGGQFGHPDVPNIDDIERAIEYVSRAVDLAPVGYPDLPNWHISLGEAHCDRFQRLEEPSDLAQAVNHARRALDLNPKGHPSLPANYSLVARLRLFQYIAIPDDFYLQDTLDAFRMASKSSAGAPGTKFKIALDWASLASEYHSLNCLEAYQTAIDLLPQYIWLGATNDQRYQDLVTAGNLAVDAAFAAIRCGNCALALEWLEHARCVVWNQILMLRSPLDELRDVDPNLTSRLQTVAKQLNDASSESRESRALSSGSMTPEEVGQEHRRLALEYDNLLSEARRLPGFEDFLRPKQANALINAARYGPIVVINCHERGCDALIIMPGNKSVSHISLPDFDERKAKQARGELGRFLWLKGMRARGIKPRDQLGGNDMFGSMLAALWYGVVKPVLDWLGYTNTPTCTDNLPHITWCPTSVVSFLPLHAAGDYTQSGSRVFDYVVSTYALTLTSLPTSIPRVLNPECRMLAIGQANTPGQNPLPGTAEELECLKSHTRGRAQYSELVGPQATAMAVLDAMEQHDWVHLACHAHQDVDDPSASGFSLHDDTLNLASINRRSFKNKGLAFLSACETAVGNENLPDEAIHLAAGMLMAGYKSVIATMWSIIDSDAPFIADEVYKQLMEDRILGNGEAGKALHNAVAKLRDKVGEKSFSRWVPYIHVGS